MLIEHLKKTFADRSRKNPQYSLRSFARSLDIDSSTLSAILRGKRPLTAKTAKRLIEALEIRDPRESNELLLGSLGETAAVPSYETLSLEVAEVISSWEHFAILALLELDGFRAQNKTIARRLNLPLGIVIECLNRLELLGLVKQKSDTWVLTGKNMATPSNVPNSALRETLRQCIAKALESLEKDPVESRDITGTTMAISSKKLPEARRLIQDFRRNLSAFLEAGSKDAVYRLNVQLFPLSQEKQ